MNKPSEHPQDFRTTIGGQALIEGILMRGPEKQAIVIRKPDGELETKIEELHLIKAPHPGRALDSGRGELSGFHGQRREGTDVLRRVLSGGRGGGSAAVQV